MASASYGKTSKGYTATVSVDTAALATQAEDFGKAMKAQLDDCLAKKGSLLEDLKTEVSATLDSHKLKESIPPALPVMLFSWTILIAVLGTYSFFVTLPIDPVLTPLHGWVNFVFFAAGGVGSLMIIYAFMIRAAVKYHPAKLDQMFELPQYEWGSSKCYHREMYLSVPHLLSVGGMLLGVTFLEVTLACYYIPQFVAPPGVTSPLSASAGMLIVPAVLLLVAMVLLRLYVPNDLYTLYFGLLEKPAFEAEWAKGVGKGTIGCFLGFGIGMLFLDGALYKCGWAFEEGLGLPADVEADLLPVLDLVITAVKVFFIPICFVGLTAIVATTKRGLWLYPDYGKAGSTKPTYEQAAAAAYKAGAWEKFQKSKGRRTFFIFFCSTAVLIGVIALIPPWAVFFTASNTIAGACDAGLAAQTIALDTPVGEMTKTICDGILASVPAVQTLLNEQLGTTITVSPTLTLADINAKLAEVPLDVDQACATAYTVNFWMFTMLFGLIVHLPAAMSAWHLLGRYTMLMQAKDALGGRVPSSSKKALV